MASGQQTPLSICVEHIGAGGARDMRAGFGCAHGLECNPARSAIAINSCQAG